MYDHARCNASIHEGLKRVSIDHCNISIFSAMDDFNNGVVLTMRPLRPNELFEVRLDKIVTKWAGSIEIGVTTHSPTELEFPFTMTNVRYDL